MKLTVPRTLAILTVALMTLGLGHSRITRVKKVLHENNKIEQMPLSLAKRLEERRLLGRFEGSHMIGKKTSKLAFKKVKNLKSGLGSGRKLAAVHEETPKERQLRLRCKTLVTGRPAEGLEEETRVAPPEAGREVQPPELPRGPEAVRMR